MAKRVEQFWCISGWGGGRSDGADEHRWSLDVDVAEDIYLRGQVVAQPLTMQASAQRDWDLEDCAWANCRPLIISQRFRFLLEKEAPANCQFVPVEVRYKHRKLKEEYWLVNCLRMIDCIDEASSRTRRVGLDRMAIGIEIDAARVPVDVLMFRVVGSQLRTYVRQSLRERLLDGKMTGCQFFKTW